ncbi:MAG TPA: helix-turn-helix transcriptional regulator [Rhizomicrobium sp.]|nr:helix-turn-helix transcriptional regulator [Rhizomicrobium sp.]
MARAAKLLTHEQIWNAIDLLAENHDMSASGLARAAGLDPTTFNKSKRIGPDGRLRWPSTESVAKSLQAAGAGLEEFTSYAVRGTKPPKYVSRAVPLIGLAQAGSRGYFDDAGFPAGTGWDEIPFPDLNDEHAYALEVTGDSMLPIYRDGDRIVVSPGANVRRNDRVVVKTHAGEVMLKQVGRLTSQRVELRSLNPEFEDRAFPMADIVFMHRVIWASQ